MAICTPNEILAYHCPRFNEFPDIELYIDQVVSILEKYLSIFNYDNNQKIITPTMINNYVKQRIVKPPRKKRYDRTHLALFYVVCITKRFLSLSDICSGMTLVLETYSAEDSYNLFCDLLEAALRHTFNPSETAEIIPMNEDSHIVAMLNSVAVSYANILYAHYRASLINPIKLLAAKY